METLTKLFHTVIDLFMPKKREIAEIPPTGVQESVAPTSLGEETETALSTEVVDMFPSTEVNGGSATSSAGDMGGIGDGGGGDGGGGD